MIDISNAFTTFSEPVAAFFHRPNVGFYIPLYQREYSWDRDNISQLMEDICHGVENLLTNDKEIRFLGTIIRIRENNPQANIKPIDLRALPDTIFNIIDGQQRISTIALLGCLLYDRLRKQRRKLAKDIFYDELREEIDSKLTTLEELFSLDLQRGKPPRKPIIIRGNKDGWTLNAPDDEFYNSKVATFLAAFIRALHERKKLPSPPKDKYVGPNIRLMDQWLRAVEDAHQNTNSEEKDFPSAWTILDRIDQNSIWSYQRQSFVDLVKDFPRHPDKTNDTLCRIVQLLAFIHYLLQRCCFTRIEPTSEDWAFDMFQSLNATGTPLTAIETFKPLVVSFTNSHDGGFKGSKSETYLKHVDGLFADKGSAAQKNRLTNEYLTTFALSIDGSKLARQFSHQRRWLTEKYNRSSTSKNREEFAQYMGELAIYYKMILDFDHEESSFLAHLDGIPMYEKQLATFCILYLQDSNHKMAHTILSQFYALALRKKPNASLEFLHASKAVAAFYTLWRSAVSNSGLDNVYRQILNGNEEEKFEALSWEGDRTHFNANQLKTYLRNALFKRGLGNKEAWLNHSLKDYKLNKAKPVCRFGLFIAAQDTNPDSLSPGLMCIGTDRSTIEYWTPLAWRGKYFRTVEHIAPDRPQKPLIWDTKLYDPDDYQLIGNLTLLPAKINTSASNRDWKAKYIYYRHLAEKNPDNLKDLEQLANKHGVKLHSETIELLKNTPHNHHMIPIAEVGIGGHWNHDMVLARTKRICNIVWDRMYSWLL